MTPELIIACDVEDDTALDFLVAVTHDIPGVKGYKLGATMAVHYGLKYLTSIVFNHCGDKVLMYDHQKAGTDTPHTAEKFMKSCRRSAVDSVILFPMAGPETEVAWIRAAREEGLVPIVGGVMSHDKYLYDEGGFITRYWEMYRIAGDEGVTEFVAPATRISTAAIFKQFGGQGIKFYTPGVGKQGGQIQHLKLWSIFSDAQIIPIIGTSIYASSDPQAATKYFLQ